LKRRSLNLQEPSEPVQACKGFALPFTSPVVIYINEILRTIKLNCGKAAEISITALKRSNEIGQDFYLNLCLVHDTETESEKFPSTQSSAGNVKFLGQDILGVYSNEKQREPKQVTETLEMFQEGSFKDKTRCLTPTVIYSSGLLHTANNVTSVPITYK
jgi:hypothetical protein